MKTRNTITLKYFWIFLLISLATDSTIAKDSGLYSSKHSSSGGGTIQGFLIDKKTNNPVTGVSVSLLTPGGLVREWIKTDKNGAFTHNDVPSKDTYISLYVKIDPIYNIPYASFLKDASGNKMKFNLHEGERVDLGKITYEVVNDKGEVEAICFNEIGNQSKKLFKHLASSLLPKFKSELKERNEIRIRNPNDFVVLVGILSGNTGKNFQVAANGVRSVFVPDGKYEIYFVYSDKSDALFKGDDFSLNNNGIEIQIVKVAGGNYEIKQVK